jgi:hypothetical protein
MVDMRVEMKVQLTADLKELKKAAMMELTLVDYSVVHLDEMLAGRMASMTVLMKVAWSVSNWAVPKVIHLVDLMVPHLAVTMDKQKVAKSVDKLVRMMADYWVSNSVEK